MDPKSMMGRGKYAKFTAAMDVCLLEEVRENNPYTARHGSRLPMWEKVSKSVGFKLFGNADAYSWHTCRDRVAALIRLYEEGEVNKLFKRGSEEDNAKKEQLLKELIDIKKAPRDDAPGTPMGKKAMKMSQPTSGRGKKRKLPLSIPPAAPSFATSTGHSNVGLVGDEASNSLLFRQRIMDLIETKVAFDMEQRKRETVLREQELELQQRFLEFLQKQ